MPFYSIKDLDQTGARGSGTDIDVTSAGVPGEFMKFGIVHKPEGKGSKLHEHPNEEQFTIIIEGEMHFVLGDEDRVVGPGTLVHIPRNVRHRSRAVNGPATFLTVKSPAHDGNLHKDRIVHSEAETAKVEALYPGNK